MGESLGLTVTPMRDLVPVEEKAGLLRALRDRAGERYQRVGAILLDGRPWAMAAAAAGVTRQALSDYSRRHPDVGALLDRCEAIGFSNVVESELYNRALAGADDRSSAQLLQFIAKSRREEYRDKAQVTLAIHAAAASAEGNISADWQRASDSTTERIT